MTTYLYLYLSLYIHIYIYIYNCVCVCVCVCVCLFFQNQDSPCKIFIFSKVGFVISPVVNLLLGLTLEIFLKSQIFSGESISIYRDTETGYHCFPVVHGNESWKTIPL